MELTLSTKYDKRFIRQAWESTPEHVQLGSAPNLIHAIQQRMVDTEDAGVRKALVSMGWTPPGECKCKQPTTPPAEAPQ